MKKIFHKINKYMFYAGLIGLVGLLILVLCSPEEISGIPAIAMLVCMVAILGMGIFAAISFVMVIVEGFQKDKKAVLKRLLLQFVTLFFAFSIVTLMDKETEFEVVKILLRSAVLTVGIIGCEYMHAKHEDVNPILGN